MMPTIASASMPTGMGTPPPRASSPVNNPIPATMVVVILSTLSPLVLILRKVRAEPCICLREELVHGADGTAALSGDGHAVLIEAVPGGEHLAPALAALTRAAGTAARPAGRALRTVPNASARRRQL